MGFGLRHPLDLQGVNDILVDRLVGPNGIVLEDNPNPSLLGRDVDFSGRRGNEPIANADLAAVGLLEPGDQSQDDGFAAPRGAEEGEAFAVSDRDGEIADDVVAPEGFEDLLEGDIRHWATCSLGTGP